MHRTLRRLGLPAGALLGTMALFVLDAGPAYASLPYGQPISGEMTWYNDSGYGACGTYIDAATQDLVAVPAAWWTAPNPNDDQLCQGVSVQVGYNGKTITVPVADKCPTCASDHIDLSAPAFAQLADPNLGVVSGITWMFVGSGGGTTGGGGSDTQPPTAPANLTVTGHTSSSVSLSWTASTDNVGVTGYDVYSSGTRVAGVTGTSTTVSGLTAATTYSFTVTAHDAAGNVSAASGAATATTDAAGGGTCPAAWSAGTSYVPGDTVSYAGHRYTATYYSTGAVPNDPSSWAVWKDDGPC